WVQESRELFALMNVILALIHPGQYEAGRKGLRLCKNFHATVSSARAWESVFTAVGIISNRVTVPHKDIGGYLPWYDLLFTCGDYDGGVFDIPGLGLEFSYPPGAVVAICGKFIRHHVPMVRGNRVCCAFYMRKNVQTWADSGVPHWSME
ncbi:hypothetical protein CONPUDRAFT_68337, partial [Coniophora puteana RWD-64-598 SS2]